MSVELQGALVRDIESALLAAAEIRTEIENARADAISGMLTVKIGSPEFEQRMAYLRGAESGLREARDLIDNVINNITK